MYKLLLVDDEINIMEGLSVAIDWEREGIEVCGCASSGKEALDFIRAIVPDIMIVDIYMPVMNGIELMEKVRDCHPEIQFIVLSGYSEFEYAQRAMSLGATNYILKPCMPRDILHAVLAVKKHLDCDGNRNMLLGYYENYYQDNFPVRKEQFLQKLINRYAKNRSRILDELNSYQIDLPENEMVVTLCKATGTNMAAEKANACGADLLKGYIDEIPASLTGLLPANTGPFVCDEYVVNIYSVEANQQGLRQYLEKTWAYLRDQHDLLLVIGIGESVLSYENLSKSYLSAVAITQEAQFFENHRVVSANEKPQNKNSALVYPAPQEKSIISSLLACDVDAILRDISLFFEAALTNGTSKKEDMVKAGITLINGVIQSCLDAQIDAQILLNEQLRFFDTIVCCHTISGLKATVSNLLRNLVVLASQRGNACSTIHATMNYILDHYFQDLTLELLSQKVFITPGYLSILFKQETGINFIDYLHKYRVQIAKKLMKDPQYKIYEISEKVGFHNAKYFSQIFKKYTGLTPKEFRSYSFGIAEHQRDG